MIVLQPVGGLVFDASFDSANCARVEQLGEHEFALWTAPDCAGTPHETKFRSWFHFSVSGAPAGRVLTFVVHNMNCQGHLFKHDMRPVHRSLPSRPQWERVLYPTQTSGTKAQDNFVLRFRHKVESAETMFFALCYPQAYVESHSRLAHLDALFGLPPAKFCQPSMQPEPATAKEQPGELAAASTGGSSQLDIKGPTPAQLLEAAAVSCASNGLPRRRPNGIYYYRELLVKSLEGRRVDMVTISGMEGMSEEEEERIGGLFPDGRPRPRRFVGKKVFFLSARVHPGETPASHVLDGFLSFILRENDPRAKKLRERFVFKLVPLVNPDGVYRGHYRADTLGMNLNRLYLSCSLEKQPAIFAIGQAIQQLHAREELMFYIDLHAHANKRGCFLFGNALPFERMVENVLYAKLVSMNSRWFDFNGCDFSLRNMVRKDKRDGMSKEGSGRVGVYTMTKLTYVYTLECNYNEGRIVNKLHPVPLPQNTKDAAAISPPSSPPRGPALKYSPASWQDVGKGLAISVLDALNINPASRLGEGGLTRARSVVSAWVRAQARKEEARAAARAARGDQAADEDDEEDGNSDDDDDNDPPPKVKTTKKPVGGTRTSAPKIPQRDASKPKPTGTTKGAVRQAGSLVTRRATITRS